MGDTIDREYPNIWRFLFGVTFAFLIVVIIFFSLPSEKEEKTIYPYLDIVNNPPFYISDSNYNITIYTEEILYTHYNSTNITKTLNNTNIINLYDYLRRHITFGEPEPKRPVEVLERGRAEAVGLNSLYASMLLTLDHGNESIFLLLSNYKNQNTSGVLYTLNNITYYKSFDIPNNFSISNPIEVYNLTIDPQYIITQSESIPFNIKTDFYFWINNLMRGDSN